MGIRPLHKKTIYILFALSGFCALVYEILWTKYLSLTFGTTMPAVSIVAATFMGGLALGSYLLGRHADRETNLLRLYALLEAGIGVFALLFPPTLKVATDVHIALEHLTPDQPAATLALHFIFAALLLVPPTLCMGGTFPLMCRFFARKKSGGQIGRLYAMNTLGATLGAFLAGFLLIPSIGLSATGYLAVFLNLAIAAITFRLSRRFGTTTSRDVSQATRPEQPLKAAEHRPWLIAIALIGFLSLAYEIFWTRVFLLFLGNTTYAFSLMLSAFLVGIALGGAIYARKVHPELNEKKVFIVLTALMGVSVLATIPFYDRLAFVFQFAHQVSGDRWWHLSMLSYLIVFAVMAVPTILSGSLLPAAVAILDPGRVRTGEGVGLVVLHNTVGAVLGSLAAGFLLIPAAGVQTSFRLMAGLNVLLALALYLHCRSSLRLSKSVPVLIGLGLVLSLTPFQWDQSLINSGVYCYAPKYAQNGGLRRVLDGERILEVIEGVETTVAVHESADGLVRFFTVNGKTDGGTGRDMGTQVLVGHIPMLLHPAPRETLVIGLGSGITLGGLTEHPVQSIDCVEISPEVVKAAAYFAEANRGALQDRHINLSIEDGRNLLLTTHKCYDVIISEPSNPWQTGNANLFTADFYRLAASRLKDRGLFCQWIGLYDITPENLRIAVATFLDTFPRVLAFRSGSDLIMVGGSDPLHFDYLSMQSRFNSAGVGTVLGKIGLGSVGDLLARHYLGDETALRHFSNGAAINTDDLPILEFSARYNLGEKTLGAYQMLNIKALTASLNEIIMPLRNLGSSPAAIANALRELGNGYIKAGMDEEAAYFIRKAAEFEQPFSDTPFEG